MSIDKGNRPLCECHDAPMYWLKDKRHSKSGYWQCSVKKQSWNNKYECSAKGRENRRKIEKRFFENGNKKKSGERYREKVMNDPVKRMLRNTTKRIWRAEKSYQRMLEEEDGWL